MIIIKSQSGNSIIKCESVVKNMKSQIIANYQRLIDGEGSLTEEYDLLGEYDTKERAEEVMGMIEEHMKSAHLNQMICKISSVNYPDATFEELYNSLLNHKELAIFEMPKE